MRLLLMNLSIFIFDVDHFQSVFYLVPNSTAGSTKLYLSRQLVQQEHHLHCAIILLPFSHPMPSQSIQVNMLGEVL